MSDEPDRSKVKRERSPAARRKASEFHEVPGEA